MNQVVRPPPVGQRIFQRLRQGASFQREALPWSSFLLVALQLSLLLVAMHVFHIEEQFGLLRLTPLIFGGFVVHALLPRSYRLPFFLALSLAAIGVVLGVKQGVGLVAIGLGLIGLCHLPIAFWARVALVFCAGVLLVLVRGGWIETGWQSLPTLILPVLGAMFMFRLVVYLYDLRHEKTPATIWERLSYFFMLPNVCLLLFPVVDYQTFRRTYYDSEPLPIYQKGVLWMYRGIVHLLLYRLVYHHFTLAPSEVVGLGGVVQSMLTTYLLYLRISGQFHLIIGIMCLFGFNLPETHHLYYLASSFNDYWRRINIYWKDFMMKIFYYPSFMRMRQWGTLPALAGATLVVFFGTWILHSYQWFWLRGQFPITAPDALFWGILGGLVVINSLYAAKHPPKRLNKLAKNKGWDVRSATILSAKTVGMFVFITVLWSLWSSHSVSGWLSLVAKAGNSGVGAFALFALGLAALMGVGVLLQYLMHRGWSLTATGNNPSFARSASVSLAGTTLLLLIGLPQIQERLGGDVSEWVASVQTDKLSQEDQERMEQGYYEGLLNAESYTSALARAHAQMARPDDWVDLRQTDIVRWVDSVEEYALQPGYEGTYRHAPFRTNQWGMRDREYEQEKPPGAFRMAMVGASYEMGSGVGNEKDFESLLEARLNADAANPAYEAYEFLNFAVDGYGMTQSVRAAEQALDFDPDVLLFAVHSTERARLITHVRNLIESGTAVPYPGLQALLDRIDADPEMERTLLEQHIDPFLPEIMRWSLEEVARQCRAQNVVPVLLYVPLITETGGVNAERFAELVAWGQELGFVILSLDGAYGDHTEEEIRLADWDSHPNTFGHRLLADYLYTLLSEPDVQRELRLAGSQKEIVSSP